MENIQLNSPEALGSKANRIINVKSSLLGGFKDPLFKVLKNPIDGIYSILQNPTSNVFVQSITLYLSIFILYLLCGHILADEVQKYISFDYFIKISLIPVILMVVITIITFGINSISGTPNFKVELLTGSLCGIPLGIFAILLLILKLFGSLESIMGFINNPFELGFIGTLLLFYLIFMLINILQQSLKASGIKDVLAWYLSPVSIFLAMYLTFEISKNIF
jgi:hypothetical protein